MANFERHCLVCKKNTFVGLEAELHSWKTCQILKYNSKSSNHVGRHQFVRNLSKLEVRIISFSDPRFNLKAKGVWRETSTIPQEMLIGADNAVDEIKNTFGTVPLFHSFLDTIIYISVTLFLLLLLRDLYLLRHLFYSLFLTTCRICFKRLSSHLFLHHLLSECFVISCPQFLKMCSYHKNSNLPFYSKN